MSRAFRSSAIAVTYIARQFGVQINVDAVTDAVERSGLSTPKDFINYFYQFGVSVKLRKFKPAELIEKKYIYPCVGVMKDGRSLILAGVDVSDQTQPKMIAIDPSKRETLADILFTSNSWVRAYPMVLFLKDSTQPIRHSSIPQIIPKILPRQPWENDFFLILY